MVNYPPNSWKYTKDLETLFFFFQCSEELLSYETPDSYRLPVCNSMVLCYELETVYSFLYRAKQIDRFYSKYIPIIIDELIESIHSDYLLKQTLNLRLDSLISGLSAAKNNPKELKRWLELITQACPSKLHLSLCRKEIEERVMANSNDRIRLYWLIQNYYIDLINQGYSSEHVYQAIIRFFDNRNKTIDSNQCIVDFFDLFSFRENQYEFYVIADTYKLDSFFHATPDYKKEFSADIEELSGDTIASYGSRSNALKRFYENYKELCARDDSNIKLLLCKASGIDPYSAFLRVKGIFDFAQFFDGYFKHKVERKTFFDVILASNGQYRPIKLRRIITKRPFIDQSVIDSRIDAIMRTEACSFNVVVALFRAMDMHLDAINCKNSETMLRTFWTALETLFFSMNENDHRENTNFSLLHIIQKTSILKQFRLLFDLYVSAVGEDVIREQLGIDSFQEFVLRFMNTSVDSTEFKLFTSFLSNNPLLRTRFYSFRKELSDCNSIAKKIKLHEQKVSWQLDRIYRTRNLSTHAGVSMPYINEILFNLHNYFDYAINYIICRMENGRYTNSISAMVFEAKLDNQVHLEYLKTIKTITADNCLQVLFGPDIDIINYNFEVVLPEKQNDDEERDELSFE